MSWRGSTGRWKCYEGGDVQEQGEGEHEGGSEGRGTVLGGVLERPGSKMNSRSTHGSQLTQDGRASRHRNPATSTLIFPAIHRKGSSLGEADSVAAEMKGSARRT